MLKNLHGIRVFLGSPGELDAERKAFAAAIFEYNARYSSQEGYVFLPVGFENQTSRRCHPQDHLNAQLDKCDFALFMFGDSLGNRSPNGEYPTIIEYRRAVTAIGRTDCDLRDIALFFKNSPGVTDTAGAAALIEVKKFQDSVKESHYWSPFVDARDLKTLVIYQLQDWMKDVARSETAKLGVCGPATDFDAPPSQGFSDVRS